MPRIFALVSLSYFGVLLAGHLPNTESGGLSFGSILTLLPSIPFGHVSPSGAPILDENSGPAWSHGKTTPTWRRIFLVSVHP